MATYLTSGYVLDGYVQTGISLNWSTKVINIPKAVTTLIQTSPLEIRELDLNAFRLVLKDLEDSVYGMIFPSTHVHNPPVTVSGVSLARVVELINDYTITFEDGQYAVNLVGANSNAADKVNVNQVSVRASNSAGLVQKSEIEIASYGGGLVYNATAGYAGQSFPIGTLQRPVNNLEDAKFIQNLRGLPKKLFLQGMLMPEMGAELIGWTIEGTESYNHLDLTMPALNFQDCRYSNLYIEGVLEGTSTVNDCELHLITGIEGKVSNSSIVDNLTVSGPLTLLNCYAAGSEPEVDLGGASVDVSLVGFSGGLHFHNMSGGVLNIGLTSGHVELSNEVTGGVINVEGSGVLHDESVGATVVTTGLINSAIEHASYEGGVTVDVNSVYSGVEFPVGTGRQPVNNLADAQLILLKRGFKQLFFRGDYTFSETDNISELTIYGEGATINAYRTTFVLTPGVRTSNAHFHHARIQGRQRGEGLWTDCVIDGLENAHCKYTRCAFVGPRVADGLNFTIQHGTFADQGHTTELHDCYTDEAVSVIDRNGARQNQRYINFSGNIKFINQNHATESGSIAIHMNGGSIEIDASCTKGVIEITGDTTIINNTGGTVVTTGLFQQIENARISVESLRPTHQGYGLLIYVDPVNGSDANDGRTQKTALATFLEAHNKAVDGRNDVIQFVNPSGAGYTHIEDMYITKNNVHLRATSRDITFKASTPTGAVLHVGDSSGTNGYGCSVTGLLIDGDKGNANASDYGIMVHGKFCALNYVWVKQAVLDCVAFMGGDYHTILDGEIEKAGRHGVSTMDMGLPSGSPREITIYGRSNIYLNGGDGVHFAGTGALGSTTRIMRVLSGEINNNTGFGIYVGDNVSVTTIGAGVSIHGNNGGNAFPQTEYLASVQEDYKNGYSNIADAVWDYALEDVSSTTSIGYYIKQKILTVGKFIGLK